MAKRTVALKEQSRIPLKLTIEKISYCQKTVTFEQLLKISVHAESKSTERGKFQPQNCSIDCFVVKSLLESICKRFPNAEKNINMKLDPQMKKTQSNKQCNYFRQNKKLNRCCIQFPSFMSEQHLSTSSKSCIYLKKFNFFLVFSGRKHISDISRANNEQVLHQTLILSFKTQII